MQKFGYTLDPLRVTCEGQTALCRQWETKHGLPQSQSVVTIAIETPRTTYPALDAPRCNHGDRSHDAPSVMAAETSDNALDQTLRFQCGTRVSDEFPCKSAAKITDHPHTHTHRHARTHRSFHTGRLWGCVATVPALNMEHVLVFCVTDNNQRANNSFLMGP